MITSLKYIHVCSYKSEIENCLKDPSDVNVGFIKSKEDDKDVQYIQHNIIK